ncbi:MAG: cobamide remodeling phosphodiesterase CbiR [Chloroflexota bacterium]
MRYGIMSMQIDSIIPPGTPAEAILPHLARLDYAGLVKGLYGQGFNPIELGGDLGMFAPTAYSPETVSSLKALKSQGVGYTVHLPLWSVEPSTPLTPVRHGSVAAMADIIRATQPLEPENYVLHATGALAAEFTNKKFPEAVRAALLRQFQSGARESIQTLLAETGIASRKLAVETIEFPLDLTLALAEELDLSICLDTGHVLAGFPGWFDFFDVVERCLPRLAEVHLHDSRRMPPGQRGYGEDHKPLGKGDLDLKRLLGRLESAQFGGPLIFELNVTEAVESLKVVHAISQ